jgi:hypothetical protein
VRVEDRHSDFDPLQAVPNFERGEHMSETEKPSPSIFTPLSHSQSVDPSAPSIFSSQFDPYQKTNPGPLVNTPLPEKK